MQIKIPLRLVWAWAAFEDLVNVPLWVHGRFDLRIVDVLSAAGLILILVWYGVAGAIMYAVAWALSLMMRP